VTAITPFPLDSWTYGNGYRQLHLVASIHIITITEKYSGLYFTNAKSKVCPYFLFLCFISFCFSLYFLFFLLVITVSFLILKNDLTMTDKPYALETCRLKPQRPKHDDL